MGLYDFKQRFVPKILAGEKTHTIRGVRKYPDEPGDTMYLYTGLRTEKAKRVLCVECVKVEDIRFEATTRYGMSPSDWMCVYIEGQLLTLDEQEALAERDGFVNSRDMYLFWNDRLPFEGHIYHWKMP